MFLAFVAVLPPASAQNSHGSLRGIVLDSSGARVPAAAISLQRSEHGFFRKLESDSRGEFRFEDPLPGVYVLAVSAPGFSEDRSQVLLVPGATREVQITLKPQSQNQQVIILDGQLHSLTTQLLDTDSAAHQTFIYRRDLDEFPLAARSFANIAYLAAGTEPVEPSDPTKARITAVSTGGSSGLNNEISVDGGDNSDDYIGGFLQNFSTDAIEEFAFRTSQTDADTGRTTAGSVVVSTRSGGNAWHGDFGLHERDASLNARFPIDNPSPDPKQPFSRQNYAGALGGALVKDRLFGFTSLEYVHENASVAYSPASIHQFDALSQLAALELIPGTASINVPSRIPAPFRDYLATARFDWVQSFQSRWFFRAATDSYTLRNSLVQQGALPSTGAAAHNNYFSAVLANDFAFTPATLGSLVLNVSTLHLTQSRNTNLGFALAFPFTTTASTISGFETFGDNLFVTGIAAFPVLRNQQKYQLRYDLDHTAGTHAFRFGVNFIHEPVLSGALAATKERLVTFPENPSFYLSNKVQFTSDYQAGSVLTPAGDGSFSQNIQRLGLYVEDSWRATSELTINYGLRYDTTFGLFVASGHDQSVNPALHTDLVYGIPHDYRKAFGPRLGIAQTLGSVRNTVVRAGAGLYFNDLAQNGWVNAFTAVNAGSLRNGPTAPSLIDPNYHTPYALHATAGIQHEFTPNWLVSADWTHETGMHGYRNYPFVQASVFRTDNRSSYDGLSLRLQGNISANSRFVAHYTLSSARTWGCTVGELFDYVNGVCDPNHAFAPGDYGPSGEDVRHRFVLAGAFAIPGGFQISGLAQMESARPYTLTTPAGDRAVVNGVRTTLGQFRGTPYAQVDLRVSRPFHFRERWALTPFVELFNVFNRNNPGNNFVTDISALPQTVNNRGNATAFCLNASCTQTQPITCLNQLRAPAGALGDFFGPGTTVGIPFAAQLGIKVAF